MKLWSAILVSSLVLVAGVAQAKGGTVKAGSVKYVCQSGKKVSVSYGFNKQGLPTYASAKIGGRARMMPINLALSSTAGTTFGGENRYMLGTDAMDSKNYRSLPMMITAPNNQIQFKECHPI